MKNLKGRIIGMLLAAGVLFVTTNVFAQRGYGNGFGQRNGQFNQNGTGYFCNNIPNLSTDQQTKIGKLRTSHWKEMQNSGNQLAEKKARIQTLRFADNADMNAINKIVDEIGAIQTSMYKNQELYYQDVRNILTDDQKVNFDRFKTGRGNGQGYCRGNGLGRGKRIGRITNF